MASLEILLEIGNVTLSQDDKEKYAAAKNDWYREFVFNMKPDEVLPGATSFFEELKTKGIGIALGSASKNAVPILEKLSLTHWFDAIIDGTKTTKAKPDPQVFLLGAEALGVAPENCVVFEDAEAGVEAAKAAGMLCVGIGDPNILNKADIVVDGLHQMNIDTLNSLGTVG